MQGEQRASVAGRLEFLEMTLKSLAAGIAALALCGCDILLEPEGSGPPPPDVPPPPPEAFEGVSDPNVRNPYLDQDETETPEDQNAEDDTGF